MRSQRGALVLVALLVALLGLWWGIQHYAQTVPSEAQTPSTQTKPFTVHHKDVDNVHAYTGYLDVRPCDSFSTQMQTMSGNPTRITLAFVVSRGECGAPTEPVAFATSFSSSDAEMPWVSAVLINDVETPFVIIEDK